MRKEKIKEINAYIEELRTIQFKKIEKENRFLSIESYSCTLNNGNKITREKILKNKKDGSAAIVLALTDNDEFILAIEPRVFTKNTVDIGLPAGYIEENETSIEAAKRELEEETGYVAGNIIELGSYYQDQGCSAAYNHYFLATDCKKIKEQNLDEGEYIKYILVKYDELKWLIENNYIKGLNSIFAIEKAKQLIEGRRNKMFDANKTAEEIVNFIRDYYSKNNLKGAVIGISGGKDSAVVAGLFTKALGSENVVGIWMPCHSKEEDKNNAYELAEHFGFELKDFDLTDIYDSYVNQFSILNNPNEIDLKDSNINIKPRLRTSTLYYYAAYLSKKNNGVYIVPGTSNKCEIYVGYFTKGGDNVADIQVLADLTVDQVIKVGEVIGVPEHIVHKTPDDGLSGLSDEDKLGVKYSEIADVLENNGDNVDPDIKKKILRLHNNNIHKFNTPTYKKGE